MTRGEMSTYDGHKVYFCGKVDRHKYWVRCLVHRYIVSAVLGCRPVLSKLISNLLDGSHFQC